MLRNKKARLALLRAGIISLVVCTIFAFIAATPGTNYSAEYEIYNDLSKITTVESVEEYLEARKISYTIQNSTIELHDYDIHYVINNDNSTGWLIPSHKHIMLSKLDALDYEIVKVEKESTNDGWNECVSVKESVYTYTRLNGEYFIENTALVFTIVWLSLILGVILILIDELRDIARVIYNLYERTNHPRGKAVQKASRNNEKTDV